MRNLGNGRSVFSNSDYAFAKLVSAAFQADGYAGLRNLASGMNVMDLVDVPLPIWYYAGFLILSKQEVKDGGDIDRFGRMLQEEMVQIARLGWR
jgi:hypothetical protein